MRRVAHRLLALVLLADAVAACGLIFDPAGLSTDFGRDDDAGGDGTEASPDAADGARRDADARADADALPGVHFCTDKDAALVCDDFDEAPLGSRWTKLVDAGGRIYLDPSVWRSAPNALVVETDFAPAYRIGPQLVFDDPKATGMRIAFSARLDSADDASIYTLVRYLGNDSNLWTVAIVGNGRRLSLSIETSGLGSIEYPFDAGAYTELTQLVLDIKATNASVTVEDGQGVILVSQNPPTTQVPGARLTIGVPTVFSTQPVHVRYDDVVIR